MTLSLEMNSQAHPGMVLYVDFGQYTEKDLASGQRLLRARNCVRSFRKSGWPERLRNLATVTQVSAA